VQPVRQCPLPKEEETRKRSRITQPFRSLCDPMQTKLPACTRCCGGVPSAITETPTVTCYDVSANLTPELARPNIEFDYQHLPETP
jgi:hypothetical protein